MPLQLVGETIDKTRSHYLAETGKLVQLMRGIYVDADDDMIRPSSATLSGLAATSIPMLTSRRPAPFCWDRPATVAST